MKELLFILNILLLQIALIPMAIGAGLGIRIRTKFRSRKQIHRLVW